MVSPLYGTVRPPVAGGNLPGRTARNGHQSPAGQGLSYLRARKQRGREGDKGGGVDVNPGILGVR